jgi:hypothetical protein
MLGIRILPTRPSSDEQHFKGAAHLLGLNPDEYGTHLGRRNGTTRAAISTFQTGVSLGARLIWKSERVKDGYVHGNSLQARLSVTANLGLQESITLNKFVQFETAI